MLVVPVVLDGRVGYGQVTRTPGLRKDIVLVVRPSLHVEVSSPTAHPRDREFGSRCTSSVRKPRASPIRGPPSCSSLNTKRSRAVTVFARNPATCSSLRTSGGRSVRLTRNALILVRETGVLSSTTARVNPAVLDKTVRHGGSDVAFGSAVAQEFCDGRERCRSTKRPSGRSSTTSTAATATSRNRSRRRCSSQSEAPE